MDIKKNNQNIVFLKKYIKVSALFIIFTIFAYTIIAFAEEKAKEEKKKNVDKTEEYYRFVDQFNEIYSEIQNKYVEEVDPKDLFEAAINGMFQTLDPHSQYLNSDSLSQLEKDTEGEFSGIGIHITLKDNVLTVVAPIPGTPSAKLGIQPWDRIIEIEGESTKGITLVEAVKKLTGPEGTKVKIKIYREGTPEPIEYTVTRERIKVKSIYGKMLDNSIGYARIAKFSENTGADLKKLLLGFKEQGMKGLILDLRFNTGGLLNEAVDVCELFVPKGEMIVSTKGRIKSQNREYTSKNEPVVKLPIVVLVNEASASASEIVAGALQDHKLGVIMARKGSTTFGKGSVQTIQNLSTYLESDEKGNPKSTAIRLTTAKYYTPSGKSIHGKGISPDIESDISIEDERNLAKHGLLGEPNMEEESDKAPKNGENKDKKTNSIENKEPSENKKPVNENNPNDSKNNNPDSKDSKPEELKNDENNNNGSSNEENESIRKMKKKEDPFYVSKKDEKKDGEFNDQMLDEAVKLLKALTILNNK